MSRKEAQGIAMEMKRLGKTYFSPWAERLDSCCTQYPSSPQERSVSALEFLAAEVNYQI